MVEQQLLTMIRIIWICFILFHIVSSEISWYILVGISCAWRTAVGQLIHHPALVLSDAARRNGPIRLVDGIQILVVPVVQRLRVSHQHWARQDDTGQELGIVLTRSLQDLHGNRLPPVYACSCKLFEANRCGEDLLSRKLWIKRSVQNLFLHSGQDCFGRLFLCFQQVNKTQNLERPGQPEKQLENSKWAEQEGGQSTATTNFSSWAKSIKTLPLSKIYGALNPQNECDCPDIWSLQVLLSRPRLWPIKVSRGANSGDDTENQRWPCHGFAQLQPDPWVLDSFLEILCEWRVLLTSHWGCRLNNITHGKFILDTG